MADREDIDARLVGRQLLSAELNKADDILTLELDDGKVMLSSEGDCCSRSWIESIESPSLPAKITEVSNSEWVEQMNPNYDDDCLTVYTTSISTTKGHLVIEYRNSSNGFYGGRLVMLSGDG